MNDWAWLTPVGYVTAAIIAGLFLWFNNRKSPYEDLKVLVDIHKDLPDMPEKEILRIAIARQLSVLTAEPPEQLDRSPEARQKALSDALDRLEFGDPKNPELDSTMIHYEDLLDNATIDNWKVSKIEQSSRTNANIARVMAIGATTVATAIAASGLIQRLVELLTR